MLRLFPIQITPAIPLKRKWAAVKRKTQPLSFLVAFSPRFLPLPLSHPRHASFPIEFQLSEKVYTVYTFCSVNWDKDISFVYALGKLIQSVVSDIHESLKSVQLGIPFKYIYLSHMPLPTPRLHAVSSVCSLFLVPKIMSFASFQLYSIFRLGCIY